MPLAQKQHDINYLFAKIYYPLTDERLKGYAETFDPSADTSHYDDNGVAVNHLLDEMRKHRLLAKHHWFSVLDDRMREEAIMLFEVFMHSTDWETVVKNAAFFRHHMNEGQFVYALSVAVKHHKLSEHVVLPPIYQIMPHYFTDTDVMEDAYEHMMTMTPASLNMTWAGSERNIEHRVSYFTEDVGLATHYLDFHLEYPFWWKDTYGHHLERKGENFYWVHYQLINRYDAELIANHMPTAHEFHWNELLHEGYAPHTSYKYGGAFPTRHEDIHLEDVDDVVLIRDLQLMEARILDAIAHGYVIDREGNHIDIRDEHGIDHLGDIMEASVYSPNPEYYGSLTNMVRKFFSRQTDPHHKFNLPPGVLEHYELALRDPAFFVINKYIDTIFKAHKDSLTPYTHQQLEFPGISISNINVDGALETFLEDFEISLYHAFGNPASCVNTDNVDVSFYIPRINHKEFSFNIDVMNNNGEEKLATVRIFAWPHHDSNGVPFSFTEGRWRAIELDKFWTTRKYRKIS